MSGGMGRDGSDGFEDRQRWYGSRRQQWSNGMGRDGKNGSDGSDGMTPMATRVAMAAMVQMTGQRQF